MNADDFLDAPDDIDTFLDAPDDIDAFLDADDKPVVPERKRGVIDQAIDFGRGVVTTGATMAGEFARHPVDTSIDVVKGLGGVARRSPETAAQMFAGVKGLIGEQGYDPSTDTMEWDPNSERFVESSPSSSFFSREGVSLSQEAIDTSAQAKREAIAANTAIAADKKANPRSTTAGQFSESAGESILVNTPGMALSIAGLPQFGIPLMGAQSASQAYAETADKDMSVQEKKSNAYVQGGVEALTELIPVGNLTKLLKTGRFGKEAFDYMVKEVPSELLATALGNSSGVYFEENDPALRSQKVQEYLASKKFVDDEVDTFWTTIAQGMATAGGTKVARKVMGKKDLTPEQQVLAENRNEAIDSAKAYQHHFGGDIPASATNVDVLAPPTDADFDVESYLQGGQTDAMPEVRNPGTEAQQEMQKVRPQGPQVDILSPETTNANLQELPNQISGQGVSELQDVAIPTQSSAQPAQQAIPTQDEVVPQPNEAPSLVENFEAVNSAMEEPNDLSEMRRTDAAGQPLYELRQDVAGATQAPTTDVPGTAGTTSAVEKTISADERLSALEKIINPDPSALSVNDLNMDVREIAGKPWAELSEKEKHSTLDEVEKLYPAVQEDKDNKASDLLWEMEDLIVNGKLDDKQLAQLRNVWKSSSLKMRSEIESFIKQFDSKAPETSASVIPGARPVKSSFLALPVADRAQAAYVDKQTGLLSPLALRDYEAQAGKDVGWVTLSFDSLKAFNDSMSHGAANEAVTLAAHAVKAAAEKLGLQTFRKGGDFFVAVPAGEQATIAPQLQAAANELVGTLEVKAGEDGKGISYRGGEYAPGHYNAINIRAGHGVTTKEAAATFGKEKKRLEDPKQLKKGERLKPAREEFPESFRAGPTAQKVSPSVRASTIPQSLLSAYEGKNDEEAFRHNFIDDLTGHYNHAAYKALYDERVSLHGKENVDVTSDDAPGLAEINNKYGEEGGDEFLRNVGALFDHIKEKSGADVDIIHMSGDEFARIGSEKEIAKFEKEMERQLKSAIIRVKGEAVPLNYVWREKGKDYDSADAVLAKRKNYLKFLADIGAAGSDETRLARVARAAAALQSRDVDGSGSRREGGAQRHHSVESIQALIKTDLAARNLTQEQFDAWGRGETLPQQPATTQLNSGIPVDQVINLAKNIKAALPHLITIGQSIYQAGNQTLDQFKREMKRLLGNVYTSVKDLMIRVYSDVRARMKDERGMVGKDINAGKMPVDTLLFKAEEDLDEGGTPNQARLDALRTAYANEKNEQIKQELKELGIEYAAALKPAQFVKNEKMAYAMKPEENIYGENTSTLSLAQDGRRTASTRSFKMGNGVGSIMTFEGKPEKYRVVGYEQITPEKANDPKFVKQWSQREGWTEEHFRAKYNKSSTVKDGSWQTIFERVTAPAPSPINSPSKAVTETPVKSETVKTYKEAEALIIPKDGSVKAAISSAREAQKLREQYGSIANPKEHATAIGLFNKLLNGTEEEARNWMENTFSSRSNLVKSMQERVLSGGTNRAPKAVESKATIDPDIDIPVIAKTEEEYDRIDEEARKNKKVEPFISDKVDIIPSTGEKKPVQTAPKEQVVKDWRGSEEVAPQDLTETQQGAIRKKRYEEIMREGRPGAEPSTVDDNDFSLDAEQDDPDIYEPTNWGRSKNAASLDEMKGYSEDTTFADRIKQQERAKSFSKIRRIADLSKAVFKQTPSASELEGLDRKAKDENAKVLSQAYAQMGNSPELMKGGKGSATMRDVIANELKMLGEKYLIRDLIDFIKQKEGIQTLSKITGYPDSLFEFITHHESFFEESEKTSIGAAEEVPSVRFVQRVLHALNPKALSEMKGIIAAKGIEAQKRYEEVLRGGKGLLTKDEVVKNQDAITLIFRKPQQLIRFIEENGPNVVKFSEEFGKTRDGKFAPAYISQSLLDAIEKAAYAEEYDFPNNEQIDVLREEADKKEAADKQKTEIPWIAVPKEKSEPTRPMSQMKASRIKEQYRLFKERFAKENQHDFIIAENWLPFFSALHKETTKGKKTEKNPLDIGKLTKEMSFSQATESFRELYKTDEAAARKVVERMIEHSAINRPFASKKLTDEFIGEGDNLSQYPVAENIEATKQLTQLGEEVTIEPVDAVWTDPITGNEGRDGKLKTVKVDEEGNLQRYEQANDIKDLISDVVYSDLGEKIAKQRGYKESQTTVRVEEPGDVTTAVTYRNETVTKSALDNYLDSLRKNFRMGWPSRKPTTTAGFERRDAGQAAIYRELPFLRAARLTRQFRDNNFFEADHFEKIAEAFPEAGMTAAEMYDVFVSTGSLATLGNEINRRLQEERQAVADVNHTELKEEKKKEAAARKIATAHLTPAQKAIYSTIVKPGIDGAIESEFFFKDERAAHVFSAVNEEGLAAVPAKDGKPAQPARPGKKGALGPQDRAVIRAALDLERDLLSGKEVNIADTKLDHGLEVFPEDVFAAHVEKTFARTDEKSDVIAELKAQGIQTGTLRNRAAKVFYNAVAKVFGAKLVIVSDPSYRSRYVVRGEQGIIIVNIQDGQAINLVFAHELFHHIVARASKEAYREFKRAVKAMVGEEKWNQAFAGMADLTDAEYGRGNELSVDAPLTEEEMLADLFTTTFTQPEFYRVLAETLPGRNIAQKLILRILEYSSKLSSLFNAQAEWSYENTLLLGPSSMSEIHSLLGGLVKSMGEVRAQDDRYYTPFGLTPDKVKASLSPTMQKIFPNGTSGRKNILDAIENAAQMAMELAASGARLFMADRGAILPAKRIATRLVFTSNAQEQAFDAKMGKHETVVDDWIADKQKTMAARIEADLKSGKLTQEKADVLLKTFNRDYILEDLHDDFVRQPKDAATLKARYPADIHAMFADMKIMADEIAGKLKAIDPDFNERDNHFMQSLKWRFGKSQPFDDSFAAISERSKLEGDKNFLKTKDTERSTRKIREEGFEYKSIDPLQIARQYVRDSYQFIAFHEMLKEAATTMDDKGKPMAKTFATPSQANKEGYNPVNDTATELMMKLNLSVGYRVKLADGYLKEGGSEQVYSTAEEAQRKATAYTETFGEPAKVEASQGQQRVSEGPQWMVAAVTQDGERTELSKRFASKEEAEAYANGRLNYNAVGQWLGEEGTHTKDGSRLVAEKEKIAPEAVPTARIYFHPHLSRMISRAIAPNPLLTGQVGKVGKAAMMVKNEMTMWEFAFSLFHLGTISQEAAASSATNAIKRGKGVTGWLKGFNPGLPLTDGFFTQSNRIASIFDAVMKDPELAENPAVKAEVAKLFDTDTVDILDIIKMYPMVGGLQVMDTSLQASTHSLGKMKYRKTTHHMVIENGKVVYKADMIPSSDAIFGSFKKVFDKVQAENPGSTFLAGYKAGRFALAEGSAAWLMNYVIPRMKQSMWAREYTLSLEKNKAKIEAGLVKKEDLARDTMIFIEDRFGEVNWQNMWMDPSVKTSLQFFFRSFTWVAGNFTGIAKSGTDMIKWGWVNVVRGNLRSEDRYELTEKGWWGINATVAHMMTVGVMTGLYQLGMAIGGDDEAPDEEGIPLLSRILFPRMDPADPNFRVQFGSYPTETYKIASHMGMFGNDMEPTKLFAGRLSSMISKGYEAFYKGADWRGVNITERDDQPQTILAKKLFHTFMVAPISVSSFWSEYKRKGLEPQKAFMSIAGLTVAPAASLRSSAANTAFAIRRKENPGKPIEEDKMDERQKLARAVYKYGKNDRSELEELIRNGDASAAQIKNAMAKLPLLNGKANPGYVNPLQAAIKGLTMSGAIDVWEEMTDGEKKKYRPQLLQKYRNTLSGDRSRNEIQQLRDRMVELKIL